MKYKIAIIALFFTSIAFSKEPILKVNYALFKTEKNAGYIEIYLNTAVSSLNFGATDGGFQGGLDLYISFYDDTTFIMGDAKRLLSSVLVDTNNTSTGMMHVLRYEMDLDKSLNLELLIKQAVRGTEEYVLAAPLQMINAKPEIQFSDLLFTEPLTVAEENDHWNKYGYHMVPMFFAGNPFYDNQMNKLYFYTELYNTGTLTEEKYILQYFFKDLNKNLILQDLGGRKKIQLSAVNPFGFGVDITSLKSGKYELWVELIDKTGNKIASVNRSFLKQEEFKNALSAIDTNNLNFSNFVSAFKDRDELRYNLETLFPIASDQERLQISNLLSDNGSLDLAYFRRYIQTFWEDRNPSNPESACRDYMKKVQYVQDKYSSTRIPGYRSDRGRIYLQYGPPSLVEERPFESESYPYEIWQYNTLSVSNAPYQVNKVFIFANLTVSARALELIHSDAVGEVYNPRWKLMLLRRDVQINDSDASSSNVNDDDYGTRMNNNMIINGGSSSRSSGRY